MVLYECNRCNKIFKLKGDYTRHLSRKIPCNYDQEKTKKQQKITDEQQKIAEGQQKITGNKMNNKQCQFFFKMFTRPYSLTVHLNTCKVKKRNDQEKEDLMTKLIKEKDEQKMQLDKVLKNMEEMKKNQDKLLNEIEKLKKGTKIVNTQNADKIQNNTNCGNNTVNNIKIIAYGKEDLSHLLENDYKQILNKGFKSVPALVESIHFNKNKPENHNIYISNMRDNYVLIYDGRNWQLREREKTF